MECTDDQKEDYQEHRDMHHVARRRKRTLEYQSQRRPEHSYSDVKRLKRIHESHELQERRSKRESLSKRTEEETTESRSHMSRKYKWSMSSKRSKTSSRSRRSKRSRRQDCSERSGTSDVLMTSQRRNLSPTRKRTMSRRNNRTKFSDGEQGCSTTHETNIDVVPSYQNSCFSLERKPTEHFTVPDESILVGCSQNKREDFASHILCSICDVFDGKTDLKSLNNLISEWLVRFNCTRSLCQFLKDFPVFRILGETAHLETLEEGELEEPSSYDAIIVEGTPNLQLCLEHSSRPGSCTKSCKALHVCRYLILNKCEFQQKIGKPCQFGHDLGTDHNDNVMRQALIHKFRLNVLCKLKYRNSSTVPLISSRSDKDTATQESSRERVKEMKKASGSNRNTATEESSKEGVQETKKASGSNKDTATEESSKEGVQETNEASGSNRDTATEESSKDGGQETKKASGSNKDTATEESSREMVKETKKASVSNRDTATEESSKEGVQETNEASGSNMDTTTEESGRERFKETKKASGSNRDTATENPSGHGIKETKKASGSNKDTATKESSRERVKETKKTSGSNKDTATEQSSGEVVKETEKASVSNKDTATENSSRQGIKETKKASGSNRDTATKESSRERVKETKKASVSNRDTATKELDRRRIKETRKVSGSNRDTATEESGKERVKETKKASGSNKATATEESSRERIKEPKKASVSNRDTATEESGKERVMETKKASGSNRDIATEESSRERVKDMKKASGSNKDTATEVSSTEGVQETKKASGWDRVSATGESEETTVEYYPNKSFLLFTPLNSAQKQQFVASRKRGIYSGSNIEPTREKIVERHAGKRFRSHSSENGTNKHAFVDPTKLKVIASDLSKYTPGKHSEVPVENTLTVDSARKRLTYNEPEEEYLNANSTTTHKFFRSSPSPSKKKRMSSVLNLDQLHEQSFFGRSGKTIKSTTQNEGEQEKGVESVRSKKELVDSSSHAYMSSITNRDTSMKFELEEQKREGSVLRKQISSAHNIDAQEELDNYSPRQRITPFYAVEDTLKDSTKSKDCQWDGEAPNEQRGYVKRSNISSTSKTEFHITPQLNNNDFSRQRITPCSAVTKHNLLVNDQARKLITPTSENKDTVGECHEEFVVGPNTDRQSDLEASEDQKRMLMTLSGLNRDTVMKSFDNEDIDATKPSDWQWYWMADEGIWTPMEDCSDTEEQFRKYLRSQQMELTLENKPSEINFSTMTGQIIEECPLLFKRVKASMVDEEMGWIPIKDCSSLEKNYLEYSSAEKKQFLST